MKLSRDLTVSSKRYIFLLHRHAHSPLALSRPYVFICCLFRPLRGGEGLVLWRAVLDSSSCTLDTLLINCLSVCHETAEVREAQTSTARTSLLAQAATLLAAVEAAPYYRHHRAFSPGLQEFIGSALH